MLPISLQDHAVLLEVSLDTWRTLLDAAGESTRLQGVPFTHRDLAGSLAQHVPGPDLFSALELIQELGTEEGRDHLEQIADDQKLAFDISLSDTPARELIALLWIRSRNECQVRDLLFRAQLTQRSSTSTRSYREFVGKDSPGKVSLDEDAIKKEVSNWCRENQKGEVVSVIAHYYAEEWHCQVVRGDPIKRVPEVRDHAVSTLEYRPAATDLLRFDPKTGRIGIATRSPQVLQGYRCVLGKIVAGDVQFFSGENICSLRPLQVHGAQLFARHPVSGIFRVDVAELFWRRGDRDKLWVSGRDCFGILNDLQANLNEGDLIEAKLTIYFAGGGRPGRAIIKVPNIIDIKAGRHEALVERLLDGVGIRGSFNDDGTRRNFWSLYPWRLNEADWRRRMGAQAFDDLVSRRILRPVALSAVTHPDHPAATGAMEVVEIAPDTVVGVSEDPVIATRMLTSSDVEAYEFDPEAWMADIQQTLLLQEGCRQLLGGLWFIGRRTFAPSISISVFVSLRQPSDAATALMSVESRGSLSVLLFPQCCASPETGVASIACRLPHGPYDNLLESIVTQLDLCDRVPAFEWASDDLIIDSKSEKAWYRRVELTELRPGTHAYKFAISVAREQGRVVTKEALRRLLSESRTDDETAKKAKGAFVQAVKSSFDAQSLAFPAEDVKAMFANRAGGYVLQGRARVLS